MRETAMKAWVVTVDMGLGHQRAVYPLKELAEGGIMTLGSAATGESTEESRLWSRLRKIYESTSRIKSVPLIGGVLFGLMDRLLRIPPYYPRRDLSRPTFQVRLVTSFLNQGLCRGMLDRIRFKPLPLITSYLGPAIAADRAGHSPVYCIVCDAEVSRAWVPEDPRNSRIHYLVPCERTVLRLKSYGVPEERITHTGFPFPRELLGERDLDVLKSDLRHRLRRLDPAGCFHALHGESVDRLLGPAGWRCGNDSPLTITYAVGGAGAQRELGRSIVMSLREKLRRGAVRLNLVAGVRKEVRDFFAQTKAEVLPGCTGLRIIHGASTPEYLRVFSQAIRSTDVLWTKPSELSFYCGLGIPIVIAPPIGSQELFNRKWLLEVQAGFPQEDPAFADQWLFDLLREGRLAAASWNGFLNVEKRGTFSIAEILAAGASLWESAPRQAASA